MQTDRRLDKEEKFCAACLLVAQLPVAALAVLAAAATTAADPMRAWQQLTCASILLWLVDATTIKVSDGHVLNTVPAGFASFTMDYHPSKQGDGGVWGPNASILEVDLSGAGIIGVARALAPGVLRLGGSEAGENLTYVGFPRSVTQCPTGYYYCLTRERWDTILAFASTTGVRLMFDLNLIGPGHSSNWTAAAAQIDALLAYTATQHSAAPWALELGNENNVNNGLDPAVAAARFAQVYGLLTRYWPERATRPLLVGPSVHIDRDWIVSFLRALERGRSAADDGFPLDAFAYHMYAGYGMAPDIATQVPTAAFLDDARGLVDAAAAAVRFSAAGTAARLPLIVSETAAAWASGGPSGACVGFASSFWYFDHLAHAASALGGGHLLVARQTLVGGNYSLVDSNRGFWANPDYFVALLWRTVVEGGGDQGSRHQGGVDLASGAPVEQPPTRVLFSARPAVIHEDIHRELRSFAACDPRGRLVVRPRFVPTHLHTPCTAFAPLHRCHLHCSAALHPVPCGLCRWASPTWVKRPPR